MARRSWSYLRIGLATVSFLAAPTLAQNAPATAEPDSKAPCELHIWAAQQFESVPWGLDELPFWDTSDLNAQSDLQFIEIATAKLQIEAVIRADPVASLGLPAGTEIIAHYETEDDKPTRQRKESVAIAASFVEYAPGAKRKLKRRSRRR